MTTNEHDKEQLAIYNVMDIDEASELWGISKPHLKRLCVNDKIIARKVGRIWLIEKDQANPRRYAPKSTGGDGSAADQSE